MKESELLINFQSQYVRISWCIHPNTVYFYVVNEILEVNYCLNRYLESYRSRPCPAKIRYKAHFLSILNILSPVFYFYLISLFILREYYLSIVTTCNRYNIRGTSYNFLFQNQVEKHCDIYHQHYVRNLVTLIDD